MGSLDIRSMSLRKSRTSKGRREHSETRKTINTIIGAQSLGAPFTQVLINGGILSLFILAMDGSKFAVGAAFTMNSFSQIIRILVAPHVDVANRKKMVIFWFAFALFCGSGLLLAYPISIIWGNAVGVWFVVIFFLFERISANIGAAAWMPLLTELIPSPLRGRFFGRMRRNFQVVSLILIVLIGWFMGEAPPIWKFYIIFVVLLTMAALRPLLLLRLPTTPPTRTGPRESIIANILRPIKDKNFRDFLLFWACLTLTVNMGRPFTVPFLKEDLQFPSSITAYASAALVLGMVISLLPWGKVADRFGNRFVFLLNVVLIVIAFNILSITPAYHDNSLKAILISIASFLIIGIALGGLGIAHTVRQMQVSPPKHRGAYMGVFFTINGIISGSVTVVSGAFLDKLPEFIEVGELVLSPFRLFFNLTSFCILLTLLLLFRLKPAAEPPITSTIANFLTFIPPVVTVPLRLANLDPHQITAKDSLESEDADDESFKNEGT